MFRKTFIAVVLALCCALLFTLCAGAAVLGDVDGSGTREAADARLALRTAVGLESILPGSAEFAAADSDGNGVIDSSDARTILRAAVSLETLPDDPAEVTVQAAVTDPEKDWASYDELISQIRKETDPVKRASLMHEAEDMLMSGYCVLPLYYYNDSYLLSPDVTGAFATPYGTKVFVNAARADGGKTLRVYLASEPETIDPALLSSADAASLTANAFAGLFAYDEAGQPVPACAEKAEVSADGLSCTVTLKKGLAWSDGSPLTAGDFVYSWKRAASPELNADYGYLFSVFAGYEEGNIDVAAENDLTLRFTLVAPCAYLFDLLAQPAFCPVKQSAVEAAEAWCADAGFVSNGAFICTGWEHGVSMTYEKNPHYYAADDVTLEKLVFMLYEDEAEAYKAFTDNELDFTDAIPAEAFGELFITHSPALNIRGVLGTYFACFDTRSDLFKNKTPAQAVCIRKAVSLLIDRERISMQTGGGESTQPAGTFIPARMADGNGGLFHENTDGVYYDPYARARDPEATLTEARRLLAAAGYVFTEEGVLSADTPLAISYLTNGGGNVRIAELIKEDLAALGIALTIVEKPWNEFQSESGKGNYDMVRGGWIADYNDPINMLELWTTDSGSNTCGFGK